MFVTIRDICDMKWLKCIVESPGFGTIFEFDLTDNTYTGLFNFDGTNGRSPAGVLGQEPRHLALPGETVAPRSNPNNEDRVGRIMRAT